MTYAEAIQFLYGLRLFGAKFGLENTLKLTALSGNLQNRLRFIHAAGTNGKGSTCAMLESIYRAAGLRVGLFTSPHLVSFRERIQVNRQIVSEGEVVRLVSEFQQLLKQFPSDHHPTFFEVVTVMALKHFAEQKCDLVVWETGLGGRLDATNIVTPFASVITNVGLDHQQWLGGTLAEIATEKAGIIKPGVPVITSARPGEGLEVIAETARERNAPLTHVDTHSVPRYAQHVSLPGEHQRCNAALAIATVAVLQNQISVSDADIDTGLEKTRWPARMQLVETAAGGRILLDGAHNPAAAVALCAALKADFPTERPTFVFGVFRDKDWRSMCRVLVPIAGRVVLTPVHSERSETPAEVAAFCHEINPSAPVAVCSSPAEALRITARDPFVVITGSLYLVGEAMELLEVAVAPAGNERALNEWVARR